MRVESFVGHWLRSRPREQTRLGAGHAAEPSAQLGVSAVAGSKVWDRQYKFRVAVGPLRWSQYEALLPGGRSMPVLRDWVRQLRRPVARWDLRLTLAAADVPRARLGRAGRLGLTTWIGLSRAGGAPRAAAARRSDLLLAPKPSLPFPEEQPPCPRSAAAALFGKLNPLAYKAIESATVFCKLRGNPYVELQHWFAQILQTQDTDLHRIVAALRPRPVACSPRPDRALDRLPRGATVGHRPVEPHIENAVERAGSTAR